MKTLQKLYKNENAFFLDNNKTNCVVKEYVIDSNVREIIDKIFNSNILPFDQRVIIKTKDKVIKTYLVKLLDDRVVTLNDEIINIKDIIEIERIP